METTPEQSTAHTAWYTQHAAIFHTPASLNAIIRRAKGDAGLTEADRAKVVQMLEGKKAT